MNRNEFIEQNIPLVHSCCKRFQNKGVEYDDLFQTGCIGLIKAVDGFDVSLGYKFSTYAVPVILGELKRLFRDGGAIKVSRSLKELSLKCLKVKNDLSIELSREPSISEIAERLGVSKEEVSEATTIMQPTFSLTVFDGDEDTQFDLPDNSFEESVFNGLCIKDAVSKLETVERQIVNLRYFKAKTQQETAEKLGISQVKVSRSEKVILNKIRKLLA